MAGKAYTMREMRAIVDYLTEHKAYGEVKGRKMWMEYANSQHTTRTWQSLKETFLKRIMPTIHDPYYKLSMDQVRSFRQGYDVVEKEKNNRLEFREDSGVDAERQNDEQPTSSKQKNLQTTSIEEPPSTSIDCEVEKVTGEGVTCEKISSRNRSSADTVVLEYENAEEIQRALESPKNEDNNQRQSKSFKDFLTFEPMTPLVKELLDAFETESEASDKEPQLHIDENPPENTEPEQVENTNTVNINVGNAAESVIEIHDSEDSYNVLVNGKDKETPEADKNAKKDKDEIDEPPKTESLTLKKSQIDKKEDNNNVNTNAQEHNKETALQTNEVINLETEDNTEFVTAETHSKTLAKSPDITAVENGKDAINNISDNTNNPTQNTGNTSSDTLLPNNQEALDSSKKETQKPNLDKTRDEAEKVETNKTRPKKRSDSQDPKGSKTQKLLHDKAKQPQEDDRITPVIEIVETLIKEPETICNDKIDLEVTKATNDEIENINKDADNQPNALLKTSKDTDKPSMVDTQSNDIEHHPNIKPSENTNKPTEKEMYNATNEDKDVETVEDKNPCLVSVSLFDEQFKNTKYSDSDSDDEATPAPKQNIDKGKYETENPQKKKEDKYQNEVKNGKVTEVIDLEHQAKENGKQESSTESKKEKTKDNAKLDSSTLKLQRERALANVFGFAQGVGASTSRKRQLSHRRRSHHRHRKLSKNNETDSSEWTSESDSDSYVSPPRGRRNRQTKKYLKPKASRIFQDPDEGTLYVIFGKHVYPLVKDGKHIKNFLTYRPDSGSDMEEESFWRQKYVEEKKRVNEYKALLKETRDAKTLQIDKPVSRNHTSNQQEPVQNGNGKETTKGPKEDNKTETKNEKLVFKIASKNGLECCLEGGWTQISNAMPAMVKMLRHETSAIVKNPEEPPKKSTELENPTKEQEPTEISSGKSTPLVAMIAVDPEVHEKVNKIESEIFKEIEEREKEEQNKLFEHETLNVTKRKTRPIRESSTLTQSPAKRARISKTTSTETKQETTKRARTRKAKKQLEVQELIQPEPNEDKSTTQSRANSKTRAVQHTIEQRTTDQQTTEQQITEQQTTKQQTTEQQTTEQQTTEQQSKEIVTKTPQTAELKKDSIDQIQPMRRGSLRLSKQKEVVQRDASLTRTDESPASSRRSSVRQTRTPQKYDTESSHSDIRLGPKKSSSKETTAFPGFDEDARYMFPPTPKDSKPSKGKKNRSLPTIHVIPIRENTHGISIDSTQGYQDSDVSPMKICLPNRKRKPSLSTHKKHKNRRVTRRKSYPLLFQELSSDSSNSSYFIPLRKSQSTLNSEVYRTESFNLLMPKPKHSFNILAPIEETDPIPQQYDSINRHFKSFSNDTDKSSNKSLNNIAEVASSSSMSLPLSPELSLVEKMSLSRELINNDYNQTINKVQSNRSSNNMDYNEYMISNLDVSVPLMNQHCELQTNRHKHTPKKNATKSTPYDDAKLNKVCAVRIENLTLSESLDQRLRDLLLESGKKQKDKSMEVDQTKLKTIGTKQKENAMEVDESSIKSSKKTRAKRSSTPRKKTTAQKAKIPKDPTIVEECMEFCSYRGRQSCPPVITFLAMDENANSSADVNLNTAQLKTKNKKDIIKVKIQKPKQKRRSGEKVREKSVGTTSKTSICTDSGINETDTISEACPKDIDDSVELIHNHSETCMLAKECIEDSVEFVENSNSIISLNSTKPSVDLDLEKLLEDTANLSGELQTKSSPETALLHDLFKTPDELFLSPAASSLITEDLSEDPPSQPTRWYLLSDDETSTQPERNIGSCGANLNQIFPIICAVPNLSTITESSKDNEFSNKQSVGANGDTDNYYFDF